jgi:prolyl 4-hydroxylase
MKRALTPLIFVVEDAYSSEECSDWIAFSEMHVYDAAPIAQVVIAPEVRNNTRVVLDDAARAAAIFERLAPHLQTEIEAGWRLCGLNERLRASIDTRSGSGLGGTTTGSSTGLWRSGAASL